MSECNRKLAEALGWYDGGEPQGPYRYPSATWQGAGLVVEADRS